MDKNNIKKTDPPVSLTEHLSALLDDEAGAFEQRRVLDELKSNDDLSQKLSSYALIGEAMRSTETSITAGTSFLSGIHEKLEAEEEYDQVQITNQIDKASPANDAKPAWLRPVGGFALAASVAAVAVLGLQNYQQSNTNVLDTGSITTTSVEAPQAGDLTKEKMAAAAVIPATDLVSQVVVSDTTIASTEYQQANAQTRQFLKYYVDRHMQYASNAAFVPSVRVIAYTN